MASQKALVEQLRELARDPDHQAALVANVECLRSLEQTLNSSDPEVVTITLDTLAICSQTYSNHAILYDVPNLRSTLYYLSTEHSKPKIRLKADQLLRDIEPEADSGSTYEESESADSSYAGQKYIRKQLHTLDIRIGNVKTPAEREKFQSDAVKFDGVVSATLDYQMKRATIYTTIPKIKEDLIVYLTRRGYEVLSPEHGFRYKEKDNVEHNLTKAGKRQSPAYLQPKKLDNNVAIDNPYALGRYNPGTQTETLANRIARFKKEREEKEKKKQSVLSTVVNWFW